MPFSKNQIKKLGKHYADRSIPAPESAPEITAWFMELAANLASDAFCCAEELFGVEFVKSHVQASSRLKSASTIADKVNQRNLQLSKIQDFAGSRLDINCGHDHLLELASMIENCLQELGVGVEVKNYLAQDQQGYRAIHLWIYDAPVGRAELQLRTLFQSKWANAFEVLADLTGRKIRYEKNYQPSDPQLRKLLESMLKLSSSIYRGEISFHRARNYEREALQELLDSLGPATMSTEYYEDRSSEFEILAKSQLNLSHYAAGMESVVQGLEVIRRNLQQWRFEEEEQ